MMYLKEGDIVNVDVSTIYRRILLRCVKNVYDRRMLAKKQRDLVEVTKECLYKGIEAVKPWGHLGDIGAAIEAHAKANGYSVVEEFGGHGIGLEFHEDPFVYHYKGQREWY